MIEDGDVKPLVIEWLQKKLDVAQAQNSQAVFVYTKSLFYVKAHSGPISTPKQLKLIQSVGDKTVENFTKHLVQYCKETGQIVPPEFDSQVVHAKRKNETATTSNKRKRTYIPKKRSGGYAILLALYFKDRHRAGLKKDEIIQVAAKYCDTSFKANPSNKEYYSAWDSIKQLEKHELVTSTNRRSLWFITDEGIEVARKLKVAEDLHSSPVVEKVNMSFDNGIMVTSDLAGDSEVDIELIDDPRDLLPPNLQLSPIRGSAARGDLGSESIKHDKKNRIFHGTKYSVWPHTEYDIQLILDNREIHTAQDREYFENRFKGFDVTFDVRPLPVGDMAWIAKHRKSQEEVMLNVICERKRLDDLSASIRDGRFEEQKNRLVKSKMKQYYYLVEEIGSEVAKIPALLIQSIETAQVLTVLHENFILKRFKNIDETTVFLAGLTNIIRDQYKEEEIKLIVPKPRTINNQRDYGEMLSGFRQEFEMRKKRSRYECCHLFTNFKETLGKSHMYTVKEMYLSMLMAIRGVSLERALSIQTRFPTPKSLLNLYHENNLSEEEKKTILCDLTANDVGNKKIGKVLLQKIYEIWGK